MNNTPISQEQIDAAKASFVTRRVNLADVALLDKNTTPSAGDLVIARVSRIKRQTRIELRSGRRAHLYEGDELILAYGNRYASDQFEGVVPDNLGPCQLVAAGGIAATVISKNSKMKDATEIDVIGLLADKSGKVMNLSAYALPVVHTKRPRPLTVAVFGTSMNSGKTTMASDLVHGANRNNIKVSAAKVTGTGSGPDIWKMIDAGASQMLDFTDQGYATTAGLKLEQLLKITDNLISRITTNDTELLVLEIADGLLQSETRALMESKQFQQMVDGCLLASSDSIAAVAAAHQLQSQPFNVLAIGGAMTQSPLTSGEASIACGIPSLTRKDLHCKEVIVSLLSELESSRETTDEEQRNVVAFGG